MKMKTSGKRSYIIDKSNSFFMSTTFLRSSHLKSVHLLSTRFKNDDDLKLLWKLYSDGIVSIYAVLTILLHQHQHSRDIMTVIQTLLNLTSLNLSISSPQDLNYLYLCMLDSINMFELTYLVNIFKQHTRDDSGEFECSLCCELVKSINTVALTCGHVFCLPCIINSIYHREVHDYIDIYYMNSMYNYICTHTRQKIKKIYLLNRMLTINKYNDDGEYSTFCPYRCVYDRHANICELGTNYSVNRSYFKRIKKHILD
jgi:hypothetical protein